MKRHILNRNVHKIYSNIVFLALIAHCAFVVIFGFLNAHLMMLYNILSIFFYIIMTYLLSRKHYYIVTVSVHLEIALFVSVTTLYTGWESGFSFYLIALCSLVYFCPFRNIYIPYFFSFAELILFIALKVYSSSHAPIEPLISSFALDFIYCYNAVICFAIILYAAFISNLSSVFARRELLEKNHNLKKMLNHDDLTRLYTRAYIKEKYENALNLSENAYLIMADIDDFKFINDTYGHPCGDYVLSTIAGIMKTVCPPGTDISRWGGEEFVIIIYGNKDEYTLSNIEQLKEAISSYSFHFEGNSFGITVTFGISSTKEHSDFNKLIHLADERMYCGKKSGKNVVIAFD